MLRKPGDTSLDIHQSLNVLVNARYTSGQPASEDKSGGN